MEIEYVTHSQDVDLMMNEPHVMALGFFDGVHLGHQYLLEKAKNIARQNNLHFTVMTFDPHPSEIIGSTTNRRYLTPLPSKLEKISSCGVDKVYVVRFDPLFASLSPSEFIQQYIVDLNVKHVVVGFDFKFGFKASGDTKYLQNKGNNNSFGVTVIPKITNDYNKISSTLIKQLINDGDVHLVPRYLGKHYEMSGRIELSADLRKQKIPNHVDFYLQTKNICPKPGDYMVEITNGNKSSHSLLRCHDSIRHHLELIDSNKRSFVGEKAEKINIKFLYRVPSISASAALV
ncbi:FAD synthetase family protein [Neobacillus mesonae]|uniref:FAD synthetase family protein n=1 Tax=Neobacillus mesonae TaxID=1193713 RepID=UPI002E2065B2|nr:FAD synthetase family protein [Neobacillus mesonae]